LVSLSKWHKSCTLNPMETELSIIRCAEKNDVPEMVQLLGKLFSIEADFRFSSDRVTLGLLVLLESSTAQAWVAQHGKKIIGMCTLQTLISTAEGGEVGLVEDVVVHEKYRGRGVGQALVKQAESWARQNGLKRLQLLADRNNKAALTFYDQMGWEKTSLNCRRRSLK
jgi:N-acetylglutamate synthase-like GNAT family acetyltransferase